MAKLFQTKKTLCRTFRTYFSNIIADLLIPNAHEDVPSIRSNQDSLCVSYC